MKNCDDKSALNNECKTSNGQEMAIRYLYLNYKPLFCRYVYNSLKSDCLKCLANLLEKVCYLI